MVQSAHVRVATQDDFPGLLPLFLEQSNVAHSPGLEARLRDRLFPRDARDAQTFALEGDDSHNIIGFANVKTRGGLDNDSPEVEILCIHSGPGRKAHGNAILRFLQQRWGAGGARTGLWTRVFARNDDTINLFRKWGFDHLMYSFPPFFLERSLSFSLSCSPSTVYSLFSVPIEHRSLALLSSSFHLSCMLSFLSYFLAAALSDVTLSLASIE
ncbi:hypothetical protein SISSUDRAFT_899178 [Sistotremastrum suecicum HHB10207 ss-3]|uniref:N-acetyltransferase domain-containing protein n=1 Tax=Sistotremastrum suecicum HHB10207 ss-3 TaxID=1314776 RepID=A0A166HFX1_9AGAM|nr:hypothetical protein SISSUDRAFT_899178 [Sistotremastrum suecicum HHB10207 ss-3]